MKIYVVLWRMSNKFSNLAKGQQISPVKQQHQGKLININDSALVQQQVPVFLTPIFKGLLFNSFEKGISQLWIIY